MQRHDIHINVVYHFAPLGGVFAYAGIPCLAAENNVFDVNCGKTKGRIDLAVLDRSITNRKMTILKVYNKEVIECIS